MKFNVPVGHITITIGGGKSPNEVMIRFMSPIPEAFKPSKRYVVETEDEFLLFEEHEDGYRLHESGATNSNTRIAIGNKTLANYLKEYNTEYEFTLYKNGLSYFVYLKENNDVGKMCYFPTRNKKRQNSNFRNVPNLELAEKTGVVLLHANGHTVSEICDKIHRSDTTIRRTIERNTKKDRTV